MSTWTTADIPPQAGRRVVITGATGGLGYECALALAGAGADVMLTGRNEAKGAAALAGIRARYSGAKLRYEHLDLGSLISVGAFAQRLVGQQDAVDLLINNAGVMTPPTRRQTADGFELQFGTNHLGHFALAGRLLPLLRAGRKPRVVNVSSAAHRIRADIHFDDLQWQHSYQPWQAYAQSKLANMLFTLELQRRSDAFGWGLMANAAHPGYARTDLIANGPGDGLQARFTRVFMQPWLSQSAADGALPTLLAATSARAISGGYYGPARLFEMKGPPAPAIISPRALDADVARRLWKVSEQLTGVTWPTLAQAVPA